MLGLTALARRLRRWWRGPDGIELRSYQGPAPQRGIELVEPTDPPPGWTPPRAGL